MEALPFSPTESNNRMFTTGYASKSNVYEAMPWGRSMEVGWVLKSEGAC